MEWEDLLDKTKDPEFVEKIKNYLQEHGEASCWKISDGLTGSPTNGRVNATILYMEHNGILEEYVNSKSKLVYRLKIRIEG